MEATFTIQDLRVHCTVGCLDHEREITQELLVSVQYRSDISKAAQSDSIAHSVDYSEVAEMCASLAKEQEFELIETYAFELLHLLFHEFPFTWLRVEVKKPSSLPLASWASVSLECESD
jgi:7,8-dihydroneopterin aldolase/epimerase/oxygenase